MSNITINDRRSIILGPDGQPALREADMSPSAYVGSFQGADFSRDRGYVYMPGLDSKLEVDTYSRTELNRRSRFIYNSGGGLIHRLVDGIARMICGTGLIPHPCPTRTDRINSKTSGSQTRREWVHKVRRLYMERCGAAQTYDLARRRNVFQDQRLAMRCKILDGDSAKVLARDQSTGRLRRLRYEAHQISNGSVNASRPADGWHDGVLCGQFNEMQAIRLNSTDVNGRETHVIVPASNVLFCMNDERVRQVRGLTRFYPVLNKLMDRGEIMAALTRGIKVASNVAYVVEQEASNPPALPAGAPGTTLPPKPTKSVLTTDGRRVNLEQFLAGSEAWSLEPGQSFKVVQSQNPHSNVTGYIADLVRDIAWATKYSPDIAWSIIEMGGANMRFAQADLAQQIEVEQDDLVDEDFGPDYVAWLYDMIVAGEIEEIDGWERHVWIAPARLTVDFGRDGRLFIEEHKRGIRSMQSMYGMRGEVAEQGIEDYLDERQMIVQGIYDRQIEVNGALRPMTFEEAFPEIRQQTMEPGAAGSSVNGDAVQDQLQAQSVQLQEINRQLIEFSHQIKG